MRLARRVTTTSANLDVLRATAVTLVVAEHVARYLGAGPVGPVHPHALGLLGVLMFFVHTCAVLMRSLDREAARGGPSLAAPFYVRRALRVYPLSVLAVLVVAGLGVPAAWIGPGELRGLEPSAGQLASNLLLVQNVVFPGNVLGPLWTLPLEMQMYLLLPGLYLLARRDDGARAIAGLWVAAVGAALVQLHTPALWRLSLLGYLPSFLAGVLAWSIGRRIGPSLPAWAFPAGLAALAGTFLLRPSMPMGWLVCLGLGLLLPRVRELGWRPVTRPAAVVARYSYALYLAHVPAIWLGLHLAAGAPAWARWPAFLALLAGLPVVLHHLVERPGIRLGVELAERARALPRVAVPGYISILPARMGRNDRSRSSAG